MVGLGFAFKKGYIAVQIADKDLGDSKEEKPETQKEDFDKNDPYDYQLQF